MTVVEEFEGAREDLEALMVEVLAALLGAEEVGPAWPDLDLPRPALVSRLAIHDTEDDSFTAVEIRTGTMVGRLIAGRMLGVSEPSADDLMDAVAELGNIVAGNVKTLLLHSCRLSLPTAAPLEEADASAGEEAWTRAGACALGHLVELAVRPMTRDEITPDIYWPGTKDEPMETPR